MLILQGPSIFHKYIIESNIRHIAFKMNTIHTHKCTNERIFRTGHRKVLVLNIILFIMSAHQKS